MPQNCQGHEKQGKTEKLSQAGGDQGEGDMMNKCNTASWIGSWNRKRTLVENGEDTNEVWSLVRILININFLLLKNVL